MSKPLKSSEFQDQIRSNFCKESFQEWKKEKSEENKEIYEWLSNLNYEQTSYYKDYICYLQTNEWKLKREEVFKRDNYTCQICKQNSAQHAHHKTYDRLGREDPEDLLSVCELCHEEFHRKERMRAIHKGDGKI